MPVNPQIPALRRLQQQDLRAVHLERQLDDIPRRLKELDRDLSELETLLVGEKEKLETTRGFKRDQEMQLEDEEEQIRNSKAKIGAIKTPRELAAAQREVETTRRMANARQAEIAKIEAGIADASARIDGMEKAFTDLRTQADAETKRLTEQQSELTASLDKAQAKRKALIDALDIDVYRRYERIRKRRGVGFAPAYERRCLSCKMQIPHQHYVVLRRGEEVISCENCGVLLYWKGHFKDEEPTGATSPTKKRPKE